MGEIGGSGVYLVPLVGSSVPLCVIGVRRWIAADTGSRTVVI